MEITGIMKLTGETFIRNILEKVTARDSDRTHILGETVPNSWHVIAPDSGMSVRATIVGSNAIMVGLYGFFSEEIDSIVLEDDNLSWTEAVARDIWSRAIKGY